jgi:nitrogen fixation NifU-like protein
VNELEELYQEILLDHCRNPRNFGELPEANRRAQGYNPLCGDRIEVGIVLTEDRISQIRFRGEGCAISLASASVMTEAVKGKRKEEALSLAQWLQGFLTGSAKEEQSFLPGDLESLQGVRRFPARIKCATLPWHTLRAALENRSEPVSTE